MEFSDKIKDKLSLLPSVPGVYIMRSAEGEVIYVGKAISLKNRVRQYFQSSKGHSPKVVAMVSHIADFETIEVTSENEALSLESNLIKQYKPKYNILLKDDKHFPYVRVDLRRDFPRVEVVRRIKSDGATYLGPFPSEGSLREQMNRVREHFPLRHCKKDIEKAIAKRERPCLMYQVGKCCAPCTGNVSREEYHGYVRQIMAFLNGKTGEVVEELKVKMLKASDELDFEQAALCRDRIAALKGLSERQTAISAKPYDADVFAAACLDERFIVYALFVRTGKIIGSAHYDMEGKGDDEAEVVRSFLLQLYSGDGAKPPREILLKDELERTDEISEWLSQRFGRKTDVHTPKRGEKRAVTELAYNNAVKLLEKERELVRREYERDEGALNRLADILGLTDPPRRMECFDNSHLMGTNTVSSMVVFIDGKPVKQEYRRFRIRVEAHGDDLLAMQEVLSRRFSKTESEMPELVIIDGGRTQLEVAVRVLSELNLKNIKAIGLAEEHELIYLPERNEPVILPRDSAELQLVERIRDEAHRFAISYHRSVRNRNMLYSKLDDVEGVGEKRKRALFDRFITIDAIKNASPDELADIPGMNITAANAVYSYFHNHEDEDGK